MARRGIDRYSRVVLREGTAAAARPSRFARPGEKSSMTGGGSTSHSFDGEESDRRGLLVARWQIRRSGRHSSRAPGARHRAADDAAGGRGSVARLGR